MTTYHGSDRRQQTPKKFVFRMPGVRALRLPLIIPKTKTPFSSTVLLIYGFIALILLGAVLLMLPISSATGQFTSPVTALFTATSAVCVTGLVVVDTGTYWSTFGQAVLLALFQIGGLGFISGATLLLLAIGGRLGLREKLVITESMGLEQLGGLVGIVIRVAIFSLVAECIGTAIFYFNWSGAGDPGTTLWTSVFHAVSSFNCCGMDILGNYNSLGNHQGDTITLLATAFLILIGSTGYIIIADVLRKRRWERLSLESKIVLSATTILIVLGTLFYLGMEYYNPAIRQTLSFPHKLVVACFQSITARAGGFTAVDIGSLSQFSLYFTMLFMFIGGASASVAGGLKINTISILAITTLSMFKGNDNIEIFGRQLPRQIVHRAITLFFSYLVVVGIIAFALSLTEKFPIDSIFIETFSALGTVGLSTGITPNLSIAGQLLIILAMFIGRLGPLTLVAFMVHHRQVGDVDYPREYIRIG